MSKRLNTPGMKRLGKIRFAPVAAAVLALVTGILIMNTPGWLLERTVVASGLPQFFPAAKPPLGDTARMLLALATALLVGLSIWLPLSLISKAAKEKQPKARGSRIDPVNRSNTGGDVSSHRRPIFAESDLGAPFMSEEAMAIAKDELVLDAPLVDETAEVIPPFMSRASVFDRAEQAAQAPEFDGFTEIQAPLELPKETSIEIAAAAAPSVVAAEVPVEPREPKEEGNSIERLMQRLDAAVDRRQRRGDPSPLPGTIGGLRQAMGLTRPRKSAAR
jgi:hypothetical protein